MDDFNEKSAEDLLKEIKLLKQSLSELREKLEKTSGRLTGSAEMFLKAFSTNPDSVIITRFDDGLIVRINDGFTRVTGFTQEDVAGKTTFDLKLWKNPDHRTKLKDELLLNGYTENFESEFVCKNGKMFHGLLSASIIELSGTNHILNVVRDISERIKMEEMLREEQFLFRSLMDNLQDAVYFKDSESRFIRVNKMHVDKFGISDPSEALGKTDFDFFSEEHARESYLDEKEIMSSGKMIFKEEKESQSGKENKWVSTIKMPLRDLDGNIVGTFGISSDITSRKRDETEKEIVYSIIRGMTTTTDLTEFYKLVHSSLSMILSADNLFISLYDYDSGKFTFPYFVDKYDDIPSPESVEKGCTAYVFKTGKHLVLNSEVFERMVSEKVFEEVGSSSPSWIGVPLKTSTRVIGVLVLQDYEKENAYTDRDVDFLISISTQIALAIERKNAEEEIMERNIQLQQANSEKDKFFSIIAHDLRGPMGSFVEATRLITDYSQMMSMEEVVELAGTMKKEAVSIFGLLENLLEWSRFRRGTLQFNPVKINLLAKSIQVLDLFTESALRKNIKIENNIPDGIRVIADDHMADAVFRNLISNAIKFTPVGGYIIVNCHETDGNMLEIGVHDSGIGMDEALKRKLFILSEKTNRPGTEGEPSSGLGLHLCKEFIEKMGGSIRIESEKDKGSSFFFTLKRAPASGNN